MQKDFKIGLAIGVTLAAGAVLWLATLPNLSARARALQAASNLDKKNQPAPSQVERESPSPQTQPIAPSPITSPTPSDSGIRTTSAASNDSRAMSSETPTQNTEYRTQNAEQSTRIHIVQKGDTLSSISAKYYGSAKQWRKIVAANRDNLPDPNRLTPGTKLLIP
jgi:5'-nucleotidase